MHFDFVYTLRRTPVDKRKLRFLLKARRENNIARYQKKSFVDELLEYMGQSNPDAKL